MLKRVMVVEDEVDLREMLGEILKLDGYEVSQAGNGEAALELLRGGYHPDVIVLDMMMPEMDGWQFRRLQTSAPELAAIPVIAMSGLHTVRGSVLGFGAAAFLEKPFPPDALLALLAAIR